MRKSNSFWSEKRNFWKFSFFDGNFLIRMSNFWSSFPVLGGLLFFLWSFSFQKDMICQDWTAGSDVVVLMDGWNFGYIYIDNTLIIMLYFFNNIYILNFCSILKFLIIEILSL